VSAEIIITHRAEFQQIIPFSDPDQTIPENASNVDTDQNLSGIISENTA